ncbi:MAG: NAD(P)-dependent glycerol-3-phosphate dehydrogenase [Planctomycetes bacterium]|nr:NAD(P)-dependent glycerol-3-phosphate dehydrogenase [Planctomycetota bacterium]
MANKETVTVIGDGGWGTAMALLLHAGGHPVSLWGHDPAYLETMRSSRENRLFLPGFTLPADLELVDDLAAAVAGADLLVIAVPSKFLRAVLARTAGSGQGKVVISLTKGLDAETLERPSEVIRGCLQCDRVVAVSGPSHAEEVARGLPASVVAAAAKVDDARRVQHLLSGGRFRVYASADIVGVEVAGAIKNVIALAAGILHGLQLGDNALAALATRGLAEMQRLGVAMGGDPATFAGLAGMGDLITTCISSHGRNRQVGILLAEGRPLADILTAMNGVPESVTTTTLALRLADRHGVEMPITRQVAAVLWEGKRPQDAVTDLMRRAWKDEA